MRPGQEARRWRDHPWVEVERRPDGGRPPWGSGTPIALDAPSPGFGDASSAGTSPAVLARPERAAAQALGRRGVVGGHTQRGRTRAGAEVGGEADLRGLKLRGAAGGPAAPLNPLHSYAVAGGLVAPCGGLPRSRRPPPSRCFVAGRPHPPWRAPHPPRRAPHTPWRASGHGIGRTEKKLVSGGGTCVSVAARASPAPPSTHPPISPSSTFIAHPSLFHVRRRCPREKGDPRRHTARVNPSAHHCHTPVKMVVSLANALQ